MERFNHAKASILVVDDNPVIVDLLCTVFGSDNFKVFSSTNGKEALKVIEHNEVDVIVCDVMMPEMDGHVLHQTIRERADFSHIPFVFLTALGTEDEIKKAREEGADDYVLKPFDCQELLSIVRGKARRAQSIKESSEERYEAYRKRVIHTLSHEFRTPLVAINTGTELLIDEEHELTEDKVKSLIGAIYRSGQRLEHLVSDFMTVQQLEGGIAARMFESRNAVADINDVIRAFTSQKKDWIQSHSHQLNIREFETPLPVHVYDVQIFDVLYRLLANAFKFSDSETEIDIAVIPGEDEVIIEVRDRGRGVDVKRINEAMDIFGQIDRERFEQQGGGLGLVIAKRYLEINGGQLFFENRPGGGAIVSFCLPKAG